MATGARILNDYQDPTDLPIQNNFYTYIGMEHERWDYGACHDPNSIYRHKLTAPTKGVYYITAHISWDASSNGIRMLGIWLNEATLLALDVVYPMNDVLTTQEVSTLWELNANDYVLMRVYQNSGGTLDLRIDQANSHEFAMHLVEAT